MILVMHFFILLLAGIERVGEDIGVFWGLV